MEFDTIKAICNWQWSSIDSYQNKIKNMLNEIHIHLYVDDRWESMTNLLYYSIDAQSIKNMHKRYEKISITDINDCLANWIDKRTFKLSYDAESETLTLKTNNIGHVNQNYKAIRDFIPCNMALNVEEAAELS